MMRLSRAADYGLRAALYLAVHPDRRVPVSEIAEAFGLSQSTLWKTVRHLVSAGLLSATRGPGGGLMLARAPEAIRLGDLVAAIEGSAPAIDCADCLIVGGCGLNDALAVASAAFYGALNRITLAEAATGTPRTAEILRAAGAGVSRPLADA